jgi:hypothetical protein
MLIHLLRLLAESDETPLVSDLGGTLGVSDELVRAMVDDLVRRGYLAPSGLGCPGGCSSCSASNAIVSGGCSLLASQRLWTLTDKGRRLLQVNLTRA